MGGKMTQEVFVERVRERYGNAYEVLTEYTKGHNKVLVRHVKCGYEWYCDPWNLMQGIIKECPLCNNKWKRTTEDFKKEIFDLYGDEYSLVGEYSGTNRHALIKHNICGNVFERTPRELKKGILCPKCRRPNYHETTDTFKKRLKDKCLGKYELLEEYVNARHKVRFKCNNCKSEFICTPDNVMRGHGCPTCNLSRGENEIERLLIQKNVSYEKQFQDIRCKDKRYLRFDFGIFENDSLLMLIEYDGNHHFAPTRFNEQMSNSECERNLTDVQRKDKIKEQFCKDNNIFLLRINHKEFNKIPQILEENLFARQSCAFTKVEVQRPPRRRVAPR